MRRVRMQWISPVQGYSSHRVNTGEHCSYWKEVVKATVNQTEVPFVMNRVHKVNNGVKYRHGRLGKRQIHQKIVGDRPHALVRKNDPNDSDIPEHRHQNYTAVTHSPQNHLPHRLNELIPHNTRVIH